MASTNGIALRRRNDAFPSFTNHAESFCLMKYQNPLSGRVEWLWNSRDGVTPFVIGDPEDRPEARSYDTSALAIQEQSMVGMMKHADFGEDAFCPNFVPPVGMRIFIDSSVSTQRGEPTVVTVDQAMHRRFSDLAASNPWSPAPPPGRA